MTSTALDSDSMGSTRKVICFSDSDTDDNEEAPGVYTLASLAAEQVTAREPLPTVGANNDVAPVTSGIPVHVPTAAGNFVPIAVPLPIFQSLYGSGLAIRTGRPGSTPFPSPVLAPAPAAPPRRPLIPAEVLDLQAARPKLATTIVGAARTKKGTRQKLTKQQAKRIVANMPMGMSTRSKPKDKMYTKLHANTVAKGWY